MTRPRLNVLGYSQVVLAAMAILAAGAGAAAGCAAKPGGSAIGGSAGSQGGSGGGAGATTTKTTGGDGGSIFTVGGGGQGGGKPACDQGLGTVDDDGDGVTEEQGDCNDCDKNVNPGAIEVIAEPDENGMTPQAADEDCDMMGDNVAPPCDTNLALGDTDAFHGANAIELCQQTSAAEPKWGVLEAKYVRANGAAAPAPNPLQYGIMSKFGSNVNVQAGASMLALSAGNARDVDDPNPCDSQSCHTSGTGTAPPRARRRAVRHRGPPPDTLVVGRRTLKDERAMPRRLAPPPTPATRDRSGRCGCNGRTCPARCASGARTGRCARASSCRTLRVP